MLLGLVAVLLWSTVATAFKLALAQLTPFELVTIASVTSVFIFFALLAVQGRLGETLRLGKQRWRFYAVVGALNPGIYYWVLFAAYDRLPAQQAQAINYTWAIAMALLAVPILKQKLRLRELVAMTVAYSGVFIIATGGHWNLAETQWDGVGLALVSTVLWASYWLANTKNTDAPIPALFWCFCWGVIWLLIALLLQYGLPTEGVRPFANIDGYGLLAALYVGIFEMGLTFLIWLTAMRTAEKAASVSMLIFLSPFISLLFIYAILNETIQITTLVGLVLICTGLLLQRERRDKPVKK